METDHQAKGWNECCATCGPIFASMQKAFAKRSNIQQLTAAFKEYEPQLEELENVRVVCFSTTYDKTVEVKYTSYEGPAAYGLKAEPTITVTELVSIHGLYMFFQNWARQSMETTKGSTDQDKLNEFLVQTVLGHEEFRGTSIMYNGFTYTTLKKKNNNLVRLK